MLEIRSAGYVENLLLSKAPAETTLIFRGSSFRADEAAWLRSTPVDSFGGWSRGRPNRKHGTKELLLAE